MGERTSGAKRLRGRNDQGGNDQGGNVLGAKRLGEEMVLGRNVPDSFHWAFQHLLRGQEQGSYRPSLALRAKVAHTGYENSM